MAQSDADNPQEQAEQAALERVGKARLSTCRQHAVHFILIELWPTTEWVESDPDGADVQENFVLHALHALGVEDAEIEEAFETSDLMVEAIEHAG